MAKEEKAPKAEKEKKGLSMVVLLSRSSCIVVVGGSIGGTLVTNHFLTGKNSSC